MGDRNWRDDAACLDEDPELFAVNDRDSMTIAKRADITAAKAICKRCDVAAECLQSAKDLGPDAWGTWGGLIDTERGFKARHKPDPTPSARCGTYSGYTRHRKLGEALCQPCNQAARAYERAHRARNGRKKASA